MKEFLNFIYAWIFERKAFLLLFCTLIFMCMVFALFYPDQFTIILYKVSLVFFAGFAGFYIDNAIFPYAQPRDFMCIQENSYLFKYRIEKNLKKLFIVAILRRAFIVGIAIIGVCLGL